VSQRAYRVSCAKCFEHVTGQCPLQVWSCNQAPLVTICCRGFSWKMTPNPLMFTSLFIMPLCSISIQSTYNRSIYFRSRSNGRHNECHSSYNCVSCC
jgi:hypothetical protein